MKSIINALKKEGKPDPFLPSFLPSPASADELFCSRRVSTLTSRQVGVKSPSAPDGDAERKCAGVRVCFKRHFGGIFVFFIRSPCI